MTKLEKTLVKALFTMTAAYAGTIITIVKHEKKQAEYDAKIKHGIDDILKTLHKHKYAEVKHEEA